MMDVVCAVIRDRQGRFLACLRPQRKSMGGGWEFPGGKVDPGESAKIALARELHEELAIQVSVGEALNPVEWHYDHTSIRLLPFFCKITAGEPQAIEHDQLVWCAPEDFASLSWADADVPILDQIRGVLANTTLAPTPSIVSFMDRA